MKTIETNLAPEAIGPYSQAVEKAGHVFISGQLPLNPNTMKLEIGIKNQTEQVLENIQSILHASDLSLSDVVKNTIYVTSFTEVEVVNEVYNHFFGSSKPARAMVGVKQLPKDALIEIESIAIR
ncbi:Rid family detoxifying hydrolase [Pontibacillus salicampi]|uniref:Rid family detoxifying hydrolase n=1 Tax=Pontibacillus salicampi TaxID=1449801 RepID=A0ABV6LKK9_9BACI